MQSVIPSLITKFQDKVLHFLKVKEEKNDFLEQRNCLNLFHATDM